MKLDIKNTLIIILLITTLIFGYQWYFSNNSSDKIKQLEAEYIKLEQEKALVDSKIKSNEKALKEAEDEGDSLKTLVDKSKEEVIKAEQKAQYYYSKMIEQKKKSDEITKKIKEAEKKIKGDQELLESIKNHTK